MWREFQRLIMAQDSQSPETGVSAQSVQTSVEQNHFALFDLPVSFELDGDLLASRYREMQRSVHPDRYANASDRERRLSVQRAAQINEAYQCLRKPQTRARYLLQLHGIDFDDERDMHLDTAFLMEQMALREALEAAQAAPDPLTEVAALMTSVQTRIRSALEAMPALFEAGTDDALRQARENVQKMQFLERLQQEAEAVEEALADSL